MYINLEKLFNFLDKSRTIEKKVDLIKALRKNLPDFLGPEKAKTLFSLDFDRDFEKLVVTIFNQAIINEKEIHSFSNEIKAEDVLTFIDTIAFDRDAAVAYQKLRPLFLLMSIFDGSKKPLSSAYKLALALGNPEKAVSYLISYFENNSNHTVSLNAATNFNLPSESGWSIKRWRQLAAKYLLNPQFQIALRFAPNIEKFIEDDKNFGIFIEKRVKKKLKQQDKSARKLNNQSGKEHDEKINKRLASIKAIHKSLKKSFNIKANQHIKPEQLYLLAMASGYKHYDKNPKAASILMSMGVDEQHYESYLKLISQKETAPHNSDKLLPNIVIDGKDYGLKGYFICKISANDPKAPFLGYPTGSCQSIGSTGEDCAIFGMSQANSGFYALCKGSPPKAPVKDSTDLIRSKQIIAITWAWRNESSKSLVFDNLEANDIASGTVEQKNRIGKMYTALAVQITEFTKKSHFPIELILVGYSPSVEFIGYGDDVPNDTVEDLKYLNSDKSFEGTSDALFKKKVYDSNAPLYGQAYLYPYKISNQIKENISQNKPLMDKLDHMLLVQNLIKGGLSSKDICLYLDTNTQSMTPEQSQQLFIFAAAFGAKQTVDWLLKNKAFDVNKTDDEDKTALHYSCQNGHTEIVEKLLTVKGININLEDLFDKTALIYAHDNGYKDIERKLKSYTNSKKKQKNIKLSNSNEGMFSKGKQTQKKDEKRKSQKKNYRQ